MVAGPQVLPVARLAAAAAEVAATEDLRTALDAIAAAAADAAAADLVVLRVVDSDGLLAARAVAPEGTALAAELAGSRTAFPPVEEGRVPEPTARAAELVRVAEEFTADERAVAELVAAQLALAVRTLSPDGGPAGDRRARWLELAGEALAAGGDARRAAQQALRIAVESTGASGGAMWRVDGERPLELVASRGAVESGLDRASELVRDAVESWRPAAVTHDAGLPAGASHVATLTLGQPPFAALQLFYEDAAAPAGADLPALAGFAARA